MLVDDHHLALDDRVVLVAPVERLRLERLAQMVDERPVLGDVEVLDPEELLRLGDTTLGRRDRLVLLVVLVVVLGLGGVLRLPERLQLRLRLDADHALGQAGERVIEVGGSLGRARDDQRGPGLVDQDVVDLVDDREPVVALEATVDARRHVVAQVVEAELGVGAVGHVGGVGGVAAIAVVGKVVVLEDPDLDAEGAVDGLHPFGVATGQVIVDGDDVDAVARQGVEEDGQGRGQGLALAGLHLRDRAGVQDHAADQLDVVVALSEQPLARLAAECKSLREQVVERLSPRARSRSLSASTRISPSASSSISASKRLIASTRFS